MIKKQFTGHNGHAVVQVTFIIPSCKWSNIIHLVGDFNHWDHGSHPFQRNQDGDWVITLQMAVDQVYQFRYLCDGHEWLNDSTADGYVPNGHYNENCLLITKQDFKPHAD